MRTLKILSLSLTTSCFTALSMEQKQPQITPLQLAQQIQTICSKSEDLLKKLPEYPFSADEAIKKAETLRGTLAQMLMDKINDFQFQFAPKNISTEELSACSKAQGNAIYYIKELNKFIAQLTETLALMGKDQSH